MGGRSSHSHPHPPSSSSPSPSSASSDPMAFFKGIPGGSAVDRARQRREEGDARERGGLAAGDAMSRGLHRRQQPQRGDADEDEDGDDMFDDMFGGAEGGEEDPSAMLPTHRGCSHGGGGGHHSHQRALAPSGGPSPSLVSSGHDGGLLSGSGSGSASSSPILASDSTSPRAVNARNVRHYMRIVTADFHSRARTRPIPQVPWLQDTKRTYLDDAERIFGRKEGWHLHPDADTRRKLLKILTAFIRDSVGQSNEIRNTVRLRRAKLGRLSKEYAHYMLVAAFDPNPSARIRREWRVPKTAEDLLKEEEAKESAPMRALLEAAAAAKEKRAAAEAAASEGAGGHSDTAPSHGNDSALLETEAEEALKDRQLTAAAVRSRLEGSAATGGLSVIDPFHATTVPSDQPQQPQQQQQQRRRKKSRTAGGITSSPSAAVALGGAADGSNVVDMKEAGLMHMQSHHGTFMDGGEGGGGGAEGGGGGGGGGAPLSVAADLAAARRREQPSQYPFLRQRVATEGTSGSLDASLVDWTQSFFPSDSATTFEVPKEITQRQMELAEEDRRREESAAAAAEAKRMAASPSSPSEDFASPVISDPAIAASVARGSAAVRSMLAAGAGGGAKGGRAGGENIFDIGLLQQGLAMEEAAANSAAAAVPHRRPLFATGSDDVDSGVLDKLRGERAEARLRNGADTSISGEEEEVIGGEGPEAAAYEDELLRMQSAARQQLAEQRSERRQRAREEKRARRTGSGRHALEQSLERFVDRRLQLFDGEGLAFHSSPSVSSSSPNAAGASNGGGNGGMSAAFSASSRRQQRLVDHQGVPMAHKPKALRVRTRGQAVRALGGAEHSRDRFFASAALGSGGDASAAADTFVASSHFGRFASSRYAEGSSHSHSFGGASQQQQQQQQGAGGEGRSAPRGRHIPDAKRFDLNHLGSSSSSSSAKYGAGDDSVTVDWNTTVLTRRSGAGKAGPKWHRANERLVRMSRGQQQ